MDEIKNRIASQEVKQNQMLQIFENSMERLEKRMVRYMKIQQEPSPRPSAKPSNKEQPDFESNQGDAKNEDDYFEIKETSNKRRSTMAINRSPRLSQNAEEVNDQTRNGIGSGLINQPEQFSNGTNVQVENMQEEKKESSRDKQKDEEEKKDEDK